MTTGKTIALTRQMFVSKIMSLLFNILSRFVRAFLPRSKHLLISWLQSLSSDFGAQENRIRHWLHFIPSICHEVIGLDAMFFEYWVWSQLFQSPLSHSSRGSLVPLHFLPLGWCHLHIWGCWYFSQQSWFQLRLHPARHFAWCTLRRS